MGEQDKAVRSPTPVHLPYHVPQQNLPHRDNFSVALAQRVQRLVEWGGHLLLVAAAPLLDRRRPYVARAILRVPIWAPQVRE